MANILSFLHIVATWWWMAKMTMSDNHLFDHNKVNIIHEIIGWKKVR